MCVGVHVGVCVYVGVCGCPCVRAVDYSFFPPRVALGTGVRGGRASLPGAGAEAAYHWGLTLPAPCPAPACMQRGQVVASLHDHLPTVTTTGTRSVSLRVLGQPPLSATEHLFMAETLDTKVRPGSRIRDQMRVRVWASGG